MKGGKIMLFQKTRAMSLGTKKSEGGITKDGREYSPYICLYYVIDGEDTSRKFYCSNENKLLANLIEQHCTHWGDFFTMTGAISGNGRIEIHNVEVDDYEIELE